MGDKRGENSAFPDFAEFEQAGSVEVGESNAAPAASEADAKPRRRAPPKTAPAARAAAADDKGDNDGDGGGAGDDDKDDVRFRPARGKTDDSGDDEGGAGDDNEGDAGDDDGGEDTAKKRQSPSERIRELNRRLRQSERLRLSDADRLTALENAAKNNGGQGNNAGGNTNDIGDAPNPEDQAKYPLGHLDSRYIEDKLEWLAETKAAKTADAVLQRQQENERNGQAENHQRELLTKVDDLATRGSEIYDDYQETVVDAGMRGDWKLTQTTFEAAAEAEHGERILYALAHDKKEADRVAALSPLQQLRYVDQQNAEIAAKVKPRTKPNASRPAETRTRGANSSTRISPSTDNLDDFEKAWENDAKGSKR